MKKTWWLLKVQLLSFFGINKAIHTRDKKAKIKALLLSILVLFAVIYFAFTMTLYSVQMAAVFGPMGVLKLLPALMMIAASSLMLLTTIYKASGILFGFRDYDLVMSLPVKSGEVVASRILMLYIMDFVYAMIILIPAGIVYGTYASAPAIFYIYFFIILIFVPLIPIIAATAVGAAISLIASRYKKSHLINMVFTFVFLLIIMAISFGASMNPDKMANMSAAATDTAYKIYPLAKIYISAICDYSLISFLLFIVISVLAFALFSAIIGLKFKSINTGFNTSRTVNNYVMKEGRVSSPFNALYKKELRRYFSSSLYVLNTGIGVVLLTAAAVALLFMGPSKLGQMLEIPQLADYMEKFAPLLVSLFIAMTCTTACSISLEGKNLWVLKSSPVKASTIINSKIAVNLSITIPAIIVDGMIIIFALGINAGIGVLMFILPTAFSAFISTAGIILNFKFPNLDWTNEVTAIKQSASVLFTLLVGFAAIVGAIAIVMNLSINTELVLWIITLALLIITALMYGYLIKKGEKFILEM